MYFRSNADGGGSGDSLSREITGSNVFGSLRCASVEWNRSLTLRNAFRSALRNQRRNKRERTRTGRKKREGLLMIRADRVQFLWVTGERPRSCMSSMNRCRSGVVDGSLQLDS